MNRGRTALRVLTVAVVLLCLGLACWQWQRAAEKTALLAELAARMAGPALPLDHLTPALMQRYQPVSGSVQADDAHTLLWDNQLHQGRVGYRVLTPAQDLQGRWWLIERGWLEAPKAREQLPEVAALAAVEIRGWLWPLQPRALMLGPVDVEPGWPKRLQQPEQAWLQEQLGRELMPWLVRLAPENPGAQLQEPPQPVVMGPERHRGYALQWLLLALALLVMLTALERRECRERRDRTDAH